FDRRLQPDAVEQQAVQRRRREFVRQSASRREPEDGLSVQREHGADTDCFTGRRLLRRRAPGSVWHPLRVLETAASIRQVLAQARGSGPVAILPRWAQEPSPAVGDRAWHNTPTASESWTHPVNPRAAGSAGMSRRAPD